MHKHEQSFCTALKKWLRYNYQETCFIEAKVAMGTSPLNYKSAFKEHQLPTLIALQQGPFGYKISDLDRMQKPFDLLHAYKAKSYVAVMWIRPGNKTFYLIDPITIQGKIDDGKKSLTEEEAARIALLTGSIK